MPDEFTPKSNKIIDDVIKCLGDIEKEEKKLDAKRNESTCNHCGQYNTCAFMGTVPCPKGFLQEKQHVTVSSENKEGK